MMRMEAWTGKGGGGLEVRVARNAVRGGEAGRPGGGLAAVLRRDGALLLLRVEVEVRFKG